MSGMTKSMASVRSWVLGLVTGTMDYFKVKERAQAAVEFAKEKPVAAILIGVAAAMSFLPAVVFVSFVATFLVVGLVTLLIVEGVAIFSAIGVLIFALISSTVASAFIGLFLVTGLISARFAWRLSAPIRNKMVARLGLMWKGDACADKKSAPEEKVYGLSSEPEYEIQD